MSVFKDFQCLENLEKIQGLSRTGMSPVSQLCHVILPSEQSRHVPWINENFQGKFLVMKIQVFQLPPQKCLQSETDRTVSHATAEWHNY